MSLIFNTCSWNIRIQFECGWVPFIKNTLSFPSEFTWFPGCLVYQIRIVLLKVFCTISIESVKDFYCLLLIGSQHEYFVTYVRSILHWPTHVYVSRGEHVCGHCAEVRRVASICSVSSQIKNSYGTSWGEAGYIRLGMDGDGPGICGMYTDPSFPIHNP